MKNIKDWKTFNENLNHKNEILSEIVEKIGEEHLIDLSYGLNNS